MLPELKYCLDAHHGERPGTYDDLEWAEKVRSWKQGVKRKWQAMVEGPMGREAL